MNATAPALPHAPQPSAFGFTVRGPSSLRFLRSGGGVETLEIIAARAPRQRPDTTPLADWTLPGAGHQVRGTLYERPSGFEFWVSDAGAYHVDPDRRQIEIPEGSDDVVREQRLWGIPSILCFLHRGDVPLHAAAVEVDGRAVVLAAPGRHGKTTLALSLHRHGYRVLSEDLSCCRAGEVPELVPGPALLRVRPDVYDGDPPPGTELVRRQPDRVYLALGPERRGTSAPVTIAAIVFLRASADDVSLERVPAPVALADLWSLSFRLPTDGAQARAFQQLARLASKTPTWNLYRPIRLADLDETVAQIVALARHA